MNSLQPEEKTARYQLLERIAVGGMAELYRARVRGEQGFEKLVAVKKILPHLTGEEDLVNAFIEEAKLAALLQHPNIVQIFDFGRLDGSYFIAMEYLHGQDLSRMMQTADRKNQPIGLGASLHLIGQICEGLDYAHHLTDTHGTALNIIHRDISPQNIFITREGQVRIIDFGIAKAASQNTMTQAGVIKGKAAYMSPEQAAGENVDLRSDLFSVGILLFELITRRHLFEGNTFQVLARLRKFRPAEVLTAEVPEALQPVLSRALARNPDDRYPSAARFRADLEACAEQLDLRSGGRALSTCIKALLPAETNAGTITVARTDTKGARQVTGTKAVALEAETTLWMPDTRKAPPGDTHTENNRPVASPGRRRLKAGLVSGAAVATAGLAAFFFSFGAHPGHENTPLPETAVATQAPGKKSVPDNTAVTRPDAPEAARALLSRAAALMKTNPGQAEDLLLKAVQLDPGSSRGYFKLGQLYLKRKNYPTAISYYNRAADLDPAFAKTFFNLGYAYMKTGSWEMAEKAFGRVVKLSPPYLDEALFNLAMAQEKQGARQACIENLKQALAVNPENQLARHYLQRLDI
jgi:tetratricopeptide (TPR) repeat protein